MPALDFSAGNQSLGRYDVVGQYAAGTRDFVQHVALHNTDSSEVDYGQAVDVVHMGPPLKMDRAVDAHVGGRIPLTTAEITRIGTWIEKIADEYKRAGAQAWWQQFIIHPPWADFRDPNTRVRRYRRFSCAGFVLDAHLQVGVELLRLDERALPKVNEETLASAYPLDAVQHPSVRRRLGIPGDGPWRIVLAGYVLHSLNRTSAEIRQEPYQARAGNERF